MSEETNPEEEELVELLFARAVNLVQAEHEAFLESECGSNPAVRDELARLLHGLAAQDRVERLKLGAPLPAGTRIDSYELGERIGQGGMGEVYAAEQLEPIKRKVALKLIKPGMDSAQVVVRFEAERQALARMSHPNVAQVFDGGQTAEGRPYFVMELVTGESIAEYCNRKKLTTRERLELFLAVCDGVQHAHQKGLIHRDLKPSNLLVMELDGSPLVKVIDFGVARATTGTLAEQSLHTMVGQVLGTLDYMSPEQADPTGADLDTRSDIYSLGVVLYQLVSGLLPFDHSVSEDIPLSEVQRAIREKHAPTPSTRLKREKGTAQTIAPSHGTDERSLVRQLTGDLDWICLKALEKEPSRRYASASELADDVRRHLANEPVLAGRPSAAYRASKFVLRNRVAVAAGVLVGFAAIAGIFGILLGQLVARAQRPNADGYRLLRLEERAGKLWPAHPEMIKPFVDWLEEAKDLMAGYEGYRAELAEIRERAPERSDEEIIEDRDNFAGADALNSKEETLEQLQQWLKPDDPDDLESKFPGTREAIRANIAKLEPEIAELKVGFGAQRTWTFPNVADQARHDVLTKLVKGLVRLRDPETGLLGEEGVSPEHGWSIPKRLALALRFRAGIAAGGEWDQSWIDAIEAIRSHQDFGGFELPRQVALVPIGTDSDSGLQAFWHPATGIEPTRDLASSRFVLTDKTGLVFVLIPGGTFMMGTPKTSPGAPNHESYLGGNEFPAHPESVGPFFISKFEMSQAQWETAWNANPSLIQYNMGLWREPTNPITLVSWDECDETLRRLGLVLPIEKQWEYAARAGTESTWWPGDDLSLLQDVANVGDETTFRYFWHRNYSNDDPNREFDASSALPMPNGASFKWTEVSGLDSGRLTVDSVHSNAANGWGLHNVHGNVSEFCLNQPYQYGTESGRDSSTALLRSVRGGNKQLPASFAKSASRSDQSREDRRPGVGIRPALAISR